MSDLHVVVLAAGKGTRMKSDRPKVLHRVVGLPMIEHVLRTAAQLSPRTTTVVVGHQADAVQAALADRPELGFVVQEPQLGTGHALLATEAALAGARGTLVLLSGDVPLLSAATLGALVAHHTATRAAATVVTALVDEPHGYGRVVRETAGGSIVRIVEERDASPAERGIREINSGIYAFALDGLFDALRSIATGNAQREYYLPDLVAIYRAAGRPVETTAAKDAAEISGINTRMELAAVNQAMRAAKNHQVMSDGATLEDPATTYIGRDVAIGVDTIVHPGVTIEGQTTIGAGCEIRSGARITDSSLADGVLVLDHSVVVNCTVGPGASIGPFAHLKNGTSIGARAKVGNFVEVKNTQLGAGSKSMHLTYLGDAVIGERVNVGAGTITCNYDGRVKQTTTIEDGAFIGSDTQLVAPVTVGKDAYVGTGTTVRKDVPAGALAVSAGKQRNLDGWVDRKRRKT